MPATTAHHATAHHAERAALTAEVAAALALQYGLAQLLSHAVTAATRRETVELSGRPRASTPRV